ncbi:MAG: hypothetical protein GX790_09515 [Syntrophomonadaceae bacterium]|nr:hypothetical protein [Syntrophomonadaceae bacterium]
MGYIGAVIGAGFASGQDIIQFFVSFGLYGLKGVILAGILFGILGGMLLYIAHQKKISTYQDLLVILWGIRAAPIIDFLLAIFLFLGISTMLSASGAIFYEHINLSQGLGVFSAYVLTALFLIWGKNGLVTSFNVLVPIKIILIIVITVYAAFFISSSQIGTYTAFLRPEDIRFWGISSILYVAYNFALAMVILTEYQTLTDKKGAVAGGIWGGLVLGFLLLLTFLALSKFLPVVLHYEVPMLYVAGNISLTAKHFYTIVLWLGILTTALANTYGFAQRFAEFTGVSYKSCLIICLTLALPIAMQDFSVLVGKVYPLFGILGLFIVGALIYKFTKEFLGQVYYNITQRK